MTILINTNDESAPSISYTPYEDVNLAPGYLYLTAVLLAVYTHRNWSSAAPHKELNPADTHEENSTIAEGSTIIHYNKNKYVKHNSKIMKTLCGTAILIKIDSETGHTRDLIIL